MRQTLYPLSYEGFHSFTIIKLLKLYLLDSRLRKRGILSSSPSSSAQPQRSLEEIFEDLCLHKRSRAPPGCEDDELERYNDQELPQGMDSYRYLFEDDYLESRYCDCETLEEWVARIKHKDEALDNQLEKGTVQEQVMNYVLSGDRFQNAVLTAHFGKGRIIIYKYFALLRIN